MLVQSVKHTKPRYVIFFCALFYVDLLLYVAVRLPWKGVGGNAPLYVYIVFSMAFLRTAFTVYVL
jgi:hypothetical protein